MIRGENKLGGEDIAFPRVCGGDPDAEQDNTKPITLFPACAGVIPPLNPCIIATLSFPRVCGGDPSSGKSDNRYKHFSPRVRG